MNDEFAPDPALEGELVRWLQAFADLAGYPGPSLVVVGDDEDEIPIAHTLALRGGLPCSQLTVVPGTGHRLLMEKRDQPNRVIMDFLTASVEETAAEQ